MYKVEAASIIQTKITAQNIHAYFGFLEFPDGLKMLTFLGPRLLASIGETLIVDVPGDVSNATTMLIDTFPVNVHRLWIAPSNNSYYSALFPLFSNSDMEIKFFPSNPANYNNPLQTVYNNAWVPYGWLMKESDIATLTPTTLEQALAQSRAENFGGGVHPICSFIRTDSRSLSRGSKCTSAPKNGGVM